MKLKDMVWLWGQTPGSHHHSGEGAYKLPGVNKMTVKEGAALFGIKNIFRVKMGMDSHLSFEKEMEDLRDMDNVIFSIIGSGSCDASIDDTDEIVSLAKKYGNIVGGIMDDFVSEARLAIYTADRLKTLRQRLHSAIKGRKLEFWSVIYERDLDTDITDRVHQFDHITFWTWYADKLFNYNENFEQIKLKMREGQKLMLGVYMYDYGNCRQLTGQEMDYQLEFVLEKFKAKEIDGIVICSNCIADLGFDATDKMIKWMQKYGELEI